MTLLRSALALAFVGAASAAQAVPSISVDGFLDYDAAGAELSFFSDLDAETLDLFISVDQTGILIPSDDAFFFADTASGTAVSARAIDVMSMFDPDGLDTIRFTLQTTEDATGIFAGRFYTTLTGEFGEGFGGDFFDDAATARISAVPLPAGGLLLVGGLGALALGRRATRNAAR